MLAATIAEVDDALARLMPRLGFSPVIEKAYLADYAASRSKFAPIWATVGILMYLYMLVDDYTLTPDMFSAHLIGRVCLFLPGALIGTYLVYRLRSALVYDLLALWVGVVGSLIPMSIASLSNSQHLFTYQNGNVAALMFFVIVLRPRFRVAVTGIVLMTAIHLATMGLSGHFDALTYSSMVSFVLTSAVFMASGSYFMAYLERRNFLTTLRGTLLHAELQRQSEHDELTRLLNRRSLRRISQQIWSNEGRRVSAIMIDIDHFKRFNDVHGHLEGDGCIRTVCACISDRLGDAGHAFRYGGEEILILMDGADRNAGLLAEEIRKAIEDLRIRHRGLGDQGVVSASLGVATSHTGAVGLEELIGLADSALYEAKKSGRNRVSVSEPDEPPDTHRKSACG